MNLIDCVHSLVSGDANFDMDTSLTVGGFSQPSVARMLIEQSASAEIGLIQRFLWCFPKPSYSKFATLQKVDKDFTDTLGKGLPECGVLSPSLSLSLSLWIHTHDGVCFEYYSLAFYSGPPGKTVEAGKSTKPPTRVFSLQRNSPAFTSKFDEVQTHLETMASMDDLLSGNILSL